MVLTHCRFCARARLVCYDGEIGFLCSTRKPIPLPPPSPRPEYQKHNPTRPMPLHHPGRSTRILTIPSYNIWYHIEACFIKPNAKSPPHNHALSRAPPLSCDPLPSAPIPPVPTTRVRSTNDRHADPQRARPTNSSHPRVMTACDVRQTALRKTCASLSVIPALQF